MDMKSAFIATKIEQVILPALLTFARFSTDDKEDDDRGRFLFAPNSSYQKLAENNEYKGLKKIKITKFQSPHSHFINNKQI